MLKYVVIPLPFILLAVIFWGNTALVLTAVFYAFFLFIARLTGPSVAKWSKKRAGQALSKLPPVTPSSASFRQKLSTGFVSTKGAIGTYKRFLDRVLVSKSAKRQTLIAVVAIAVFSYLLVPLGLVKNEFFPKTDQDILYISISLPTGTPLEISQVEGERLLEEVRTNKDIDYVLLDIGADVNMTSISSTQVDASKIRLSIRLKEDREKTSMEIAQDIRDQYANYSTGDVQVVELSGGPPTGADVQLTVVGDDLKTLESLTTNLKNYLKTIPGTTNVDVSVKPGVSKITFNPDLTLLNQYNLNLPQIGGLIRLYTSGQEIDSVKLPTPECEDECPVMLRTHEMNFPASEIPSLIITTSTGTDLPLSSLGMFSLEPNPTTITHFNGTRSLSVQAAVLPGYNIVDIGNQAMTYAQKPENTPSGYQWQTGGANEENAKSVQSILQAMGVAAVLIMGTMVIQLKSFKRALIVMMAIPLAISGVFIMFALTNTPLSFPALIGVLALFGIVVKNSIMIVDKINRNLEVGLPFNEAVSDGSASRLEPIVFSSVTNIIGLLPITLSDPLWRGLGGAIISGLTLSGLIMLIFIPVLFDVWYRKRYSHKKATSAIVSA